MAAPQIGRSWIEAGLVGLAGADRFLECVVDLKNGFFGAEVTVLRFVFSLRDGECIHNVRYGITRCWDCASKGFGLLLPLERGAEVKVKEHRVQFAP